MKFLKWLGISALVLILLMVFVGIPYMKEQTKKHSPKKTSTYTQNGFDLTVNYSSPSKKDRVIFGELVPYNNVWRTGANEPTTFTTGTTLAISDKSLPAGTYSLWTKPNKDSWIVYFNKNIPDWGVTIMSGGKETTRMPEEDALFVEVPTHSLGSPQENLKIDFDDSNQLSLTISWDKTTVNVPLKK